MNHLNLCTKVYYLNIKNLSSEENLAQFIKYQSKLITESIDSLPTSTTLELQLQKPGTHDYFLKRGEAYCILIECQEKLNTDLMSPETSCISNKVAGLVNRSTESLTYILKGVIAYYKRLLGLNDQLDIDCDKISRETTVNGKELYSQLIVLVKKGIFESIVKASEICNRLNFKTVSSYFLNFLGNTFNFLNNYFERHAKV